MNREYEYVLIDGSLKRKPIEMAGTKDKFTSDEQWICSMCTLINPLSSVSCSACDNKRVAEHLENSIICKICTLSNASKLAVCEACEAPLSTAGPQQNISAAKFLTPKITYATVNLLKEVLQSGPEVMVLSSFQTDLEWLQHKLPSNVGEFVIVLHSKEAKQDIMLDPRTRCVFPKLNGYGCMHTKLILSIYSSFIRVVITSANLTEHDWGLLENVAYCQDFPRGKPAVLSRFQTDLMRISKDLLVPTVIIEKIKDYDFMNAAGFLVQSKPGSHQDVPYGLLSLQNIAQELNLRNVSVNYMVRL